MGASSQMINPVWLIVLSFSLGLLPILVALCTSFLKISIVLSILKTGLGSQHVPGNLSIMFLSFVISAFIMAPQIGALFESVAENDLSKVPSKIEFSKLEAAFKPWREFLCKHAGEREQLLLKDLAQISEGANCQSMRILLPAFVLTELKEAFQMGVILLLPFLVIDLLVANVLAALGMCMVSPNMISLPLKLLLFVSVDGWLMLVRSLLLSYA
jgi:type III secretion protein R